MMNKLSILAFAGAILGVAPVADAAIQNTHGAICRAQEPEHAGRVRYPGVGVEALQNVDVACPLTTTEKQIKSVEVNVRFTTLAATECSLMGVDWNGDADEVITFSIPHGQTWKAVTVPETMKATWMSYVVHCSLPKNQVLTSINVATP